jgi:release factor glutamine methyltransferase
VSQIVGHREFWGLDFEVTRDVLTPRPDTEFVVQAALDIAATASASVVVDIGTGAAALSSRSRPSSRIPASSPATPRSPR